ncbi:thioredoxin family protein [Celeribacter marinus]|uniref:Alkyl hydroperoxide reductase and/or thiol-specific antioxidant family (AhpC/TSA) protein n=1 Tax=Celeribacter marinus TaxID=1397108 RepID=A0A0N9ZN78_9RHOB|nr:thioredoxin family protein [Celeribacter marinus]ALI54856.1 alkyl hydroperoxide reductase and/or thiol-specific antioxidant family (AhpC/TSA) protein [Celeribacter marinus]SFK00233.1 AhpC/TSA family protein [Celeribacter marinus]
MAAVPPVCEFNWSAPAFSLPATDGKTYTFSDVAGENGTLVMFICNHCPYVLSVIDRIVRDGRDLQALGVGVAAICANDADAYPDDSFDNMTKKAREWALPFPYLHDADQSVAHRFDAVCTPDFFGFNAQGGLQYRGRLDASRKDAGPVDLKRDLFDAMRMVAQTGQGPQDQIPSMGCSIKWKDV